MGLASEVYGWVRETRKVLLDHCGSLPKDVFTREREDFGWGSVRNILVHTADCYRFWLAEEAFGKPVDRFRPEDHPDAASVRRLFSRVDEIVTAFLERFPGEALVRPIPRKVSWQPEPFMTTPLWLLTHTITHEFHHKGQAVSLGRVLGYPPPETDLAGPHIG